MKPPLFVDQEVGGSIPPNRTNTFNDLAKLLCNDLNIGVHMASTSDGNFS